MKVDRSSYTPGELSEMAGTFDHIDRLLSTIGQRGHLATHTPDVAPTRAVELALRSSSVSLLDLPYDILAIILEHIPPYEIPRLRRVSKVFNDLLTSRHVLTPLLRHHFPYHVRDSLRGSASNDNATRDPGGDDDDDDDDDDEKEEERGKEEAATALEAAEADGASAGPSTEAPQAFDSALRRFFNRAKGKPTSITVIGGVRLDACYETETSYDHMFLVFHHTSGRVFIYDSGNRFPECPFVTLDIRRLGVPWYGYRMSRRNVRQSVVLDKRILIVSGTCEFEGDPERRIPQAVYSLHNYPQIEFIGIWRGVAYQEHLNSLCANDEWIGCRVNKHSIKLIKISSLRGKRIEENGTLPPGPAPQPYEITFPHPSRGYIKDVHLAKHHVFVYSVVVDTANNCHGYVDVFGINLIPSELRERQLYEIAHVRRVLLDSWQSMFLNYIGYPTSAAVPETLRCQRWDKIYPFMRGNRRDGMPEEDEWSVMMTLGKTFRANGNVPIGCARINALPPPGVGSNGVLPPVTETVMPENIIPFCIALEQGIQEDDANHALLLPRAREKRSRAEMEGDGGANSFAPSLYNPDAAVAPDDGRTIAGGSADAPPTDDGAYLAHFGNGVQMEAKKEPALPSPTIREAWYLDQDQTQRSSIITEEGLFHIFYDEPGPEMGAVDLVMTDAADDVPSALASGSSTNVVEQSAAQKAREVVKLFPSHMQHIPLEDVFDDSIPFQEISLDGGLSLGAVGVDERARQGMSVAPEAKRQKLDKLMRSVRGGWSCYVWSAETWNGFLVTTPEDAKMVILRYD
ncbi:hypothetical protein DRE_04265 [Drechslerella stenobrocha 248]|uniref:F-box domain-containing protein n=1 Tax=Drechslerella stenobrocha 248 TaxID=1043628 RepID=W7I2F3_9PEZI|nr:hypothetical protein DRE_04265 [Drechslerella stenobrocha 248]